MLLKWSRGQILHWLILPAKPNDFTRSLQKAQIREESHSQSLWCSLFCLSWLQLTICLYHTFNTQWGKEDGKHTWFLKERCRTGSSAAREMLLSKMKNRIRLVKMLSLTIRWQWTRNLQERGEAQLYLSENSKTWETFPPPLLPAGLALEDCSAEQLPPAPATGERWAQAAVLGPAGCWAVLALHFMQRCTWLPASLMLDAFEWRTVTPSWQSPLWYRYGLKLVNAKLYPLLSFTEPFPIRESSRRRLQGSQCLPDLGLGCHWAGAMGDLPC